MEKAVHSMRALYNVPRNFVDTFTLECRMV